MFGSIGFPEIIVLVVLAVGATLFGRRGALTAGGPVLVLRKFDVRASESPAVVIEGRPSGFLAWLFTTLGLDTLTRLSVTEQQVSFKSASLSGEVHHLVPTSDVSSTHCGYSQPIWLLILGAAILLLSMLSALNSQNAAQIFVAGLLVAGICGALYLSQRKIAITVETTGGMLIGLAFKPSAVEHVSINLEQALRAVGRINALVVERSRKVTSQPRESPSNILDTPKDVASSGAEPMQCRSCGSDIVGQQTFCTNCGAKVA